ncbi:pancreatic triacylglycerol lipase-like [Bombus vancouverensis nearcticus]|uniref:phospholipase A1 n=1 Tax=Bombus bifarius TaxID=103933 RepID=A0A6P8M8H6_9HYME|nr:pancreatic triacylglycerol lipase-like [Bombus vancouverensis nearcticus]XP_033310011.1 pancreatic triacylglycerol lipase-like [Bombus bifarius]
MTKLSSYIFFVLLNILIAGADDNISTIFIRLFKRDGSYLDANILNRTELVTMGKHLRRNKNTVFFIHGFTESINSNDVVIVTNTYLQATNDNVLAVDYQQIAGLPYVTGVTMIEAVAKVVGGALNILASSGMNSKTLHVIGHSLGAQIAGVLPENINFRLTRITGLDPAGPLFYVLNHRLTSEDADFVDIIHTDAGVYGIALNSGHVDFYPNGGHRPQPGCSLINIPLSAPDFCSHQRSYIFYSESVKNHKAFIGKCQGDCNSDLVPMGFITPSNTRGVYSLTTNAESPFGLGMKGV